MTVGKPVAVFHYVPFIFVNNILQPFTFSIAMKNILLFLLIAASFAACKNHKNIPNVSSIKVELNMERFDQSFFSIDTNKIQEGLQKVRTMHPDFYSDFMQEILGVQGIDSNQQTIAITRKFLRDYLLVNDTLQAVYKNINWLEKDLTKAFQFVKYYFPQYKIGKVVLFTGPFDAPGIASTHSGIAIGLQQYAGSNYSVYNSAEGQQLFPQYISKRFTSKYITANCMKAVVQDLFPDKSGGLPLIEQMIEKAKQWYLLDKFLPLVPDSIKTGYTQKQLNWCTENEGLIWSYLVKNEDLHSLNPETIQTYIGEGPFTQGFSQEFSPGNLGPWIGWQIIKKFVTKNPTMKPEEIMNATAATILDIAKYKPK
jgi:hypothetical protein